MVAKDVVDLLFYRFENQTENQRNHVYFGFCKIPCGLLSIRAFSVFLED
jgi:hypothetical protein